jgi:uncharacterized membrane protein
MLGGGIMKKRSTLDKFVLLILVLGVIVFSYLTYVHYNSNALFCPDTGVINCGRVLDSPYATFLGVPIAISGLAWMLVALGLEIYQKRRLCGLWAFIALAGASYSIIAMYLIEKICIYCSAADIILIIYFLLRVGYALE